MESLFLPSIPDVYEFRYISVYYHAKIENNHDYIIIPLVLKQPNKCLLVKNQKYEYIFFFMSFKRTNALRSRSREFNRTSSELRLSFILNLKKKCLKQLEILSFFRGLYTIGIKKKKLDRRTFRAHEM